MNRLVRLATSLNRRGLLTAAGGLIALGVAASLLPAAAWAQREKGPEQVPVEELMKPSGLPELAVGSETAKVTIVEYASMTCPHCREFHEKVWPEIKKKYVDTGKVRFIFREFPLDARAFAGSMLARCAGPGKELPMIEALFHAQAEWAHIKGNPQAALFEISKQAGFTQDSFEKCLLDQKLLDQLTATRTRASEQFGVNSTPTFFLNGKRLNASPLLEEFEKALEPMLAQG